jgi:hypothetical protein
MHADFDRVRPAELVALLGGLLLGVSLFFPWFEFPSGNLDAWDAFTLIDILLALTAVAGGGLFWVTLTRPSPAVPVAIGVWTTLLGLISTIFVGLRLFDHPAGSSGACIGVWLGLAGALLVLVGAWLGLNHERPSRRSPATPAR